MYAIQKLVDGQWQTGRSIFRKGAIARAQLTKRRRQHPQDQFRLVKLAVTAIVSFD